MLQSKKININISYCFRHSLWFPLCRNVQIIVHKLFKFIGQNKLHQGLWSGRQQMGNVEWLAHNDCLVIEWNIYLILSLLATHNIHDKMFICVLFAVFIFNCALTVNLISFICKELIAIHHKAEEIRHCFMRIYDNENVKHKKAISIHHVTTERRSRMAHLLLR